MKRCSRVCLFGSSSPQTPEVFCACARDVGEGLARLGYICVHGGGGAGVMGSITNGARAGGGSVIGVIHRRFVVDNSEDDRLGSVEDGGLIISDGPDLTERKQLLIDNGDCIVVLPGGVGTLEELWESVSAKSLGMKGLHEKEICVVNINGFFDGSIAQLKRAHEEKLLYLPLEDYFNVVNSAEDAIQWCHSTLTSSCPSASTTQHDTTESSNRVASKVVNSMTPTEALSHHLHENNGLSMLFALSAGVVLGLVIARHMK